MGWWDGRILGDGGMKLNAIAERRAGQRHNDLVDKSIAWRLCAGQKTMQGLCLALSVFHGRYSRTVV